MAMMTNTELVLRADAFLQRFGVDCGTKLELLAADIGLTVVDKPAETFDGYLVRVVGQSRGRVILNSQLREAGRRLFTLAHEIAHFVLPGHDVLDGPCGRSCQVVCKRAQAAWLFAVRCAFASSCLIPSA